MKTIFASVSAIALTAAFCGPALAQEPTEDVETIIVTGTRSTGLRAIDAPAPVQVLDSGTLTRATRPDLAQALAASIPSFVAQSTGGDLANLTLSAKLRGVSPNHALLLINGKRRHGTSNLAVLSGAFQGNAAADMSLIPQVAIQRVEVLQEGAAAIYGTDAIAGVVNLILKDDPSGGTIVATGGKYFDGGGETADISANIGFAPNDRSYISVSGQSKFVDDAFRGTFDPRVVDGPWNAGATNSPARSYPQITQAEFYPHVNRIGSQASYRLNTVFFNAGYDVSDMLKIYSFGSAGWKVAEAKQNFRLPNVVTGRMAGDIPFPFGFQPRQKIRENDHALTLGVEGTIADWDYDLASTYGRDMADVYVVSSANADLYRDSSTTTQRGYSPNEFYNGTFIAKQWTNNLDIRREFDVGMAKPLTWAMGGEYREDTYEIQAGEPAAYYKGGPQSFYGYSPTDAGVHKRNSWAVYGNVALSPVDALQLDFAARHEKYSDFGSTNIWRATGRYDFNPMVAVRGTASTGFRAPTQAEGYYSGINVGPSTIGGQLAPNSPGAALLGKPGLGPERSRNLSAGIVLHPIPRLTVTLDAYRIKIKDRIVGSGTLIGDASNRLLVRSPIILQALSANGVVIDNSIFSNASWQISASLFTNGLDTLTKGVDFLATYSTNFGDYGRVDWSLSANVNDTQVTRVLPPLPSLAAGALLFDVAAISTLEDSSPQYRAVAGALYTRGPVTLNVKANLWGRQAAWGRGAQDAIWHRTITHPSITADAEASIGVTSAVRLAIGAQNLLNKYPDKTNETVRVQQLATNANGYVTPWANSAYGYFGGFYYGRLTVNF